MNANFIEKYRARFRKVLDHIEANLDADLSVEQLSSIAAFSKYHFHRQFSEFFDIGVYKYVQLSRLKRASYQLAFRHEIPVTDIALANGYEGPEAFARAFRKNFGQSPSDFRKQPQWDYWNAIYEPFAQLRIENMQPLNRFEDVQMVEFPETRIAVLEHRGNPQLIGNSVRKFIEWRKQNHLPPKISATFNILYDNPADVDPENYRLDIGATIKMDIAENSYGIVEKIIPAGRCALLRHIGSDDILPETVKYLYAEWLPHSGEELRDFPLYVQRVKFFPDVAENQAITDIFLPLE